MIKSFSNVLLSNCVSYDANVNIITSTDIITTNSGQEKRNINWKDPLNSFDISLDNIEDVEIKKINKMIYQFKGPAVTFKFKNWIDYTCTKEESCCNQTNVVFGYNFINMFKKYEFDLTNETYVKRLSLIVYDNSSVNTEDKPEELYFKFFKNGVEASNLIKNVDYINGIINLKPLVEKSGVSTTFIKGDTTIININNHGFLDNDLVILNFFDGKNEVYQNDVKNKLFTVTKINNNSFSINYKTIDKPNLGFNSEYKVEKYINNTQDDTKNDVYSFECEFYNKVRFNSDVSTMRTVSYNSNNLSLTLNEVRYKQEEEV